MMANYAIMLGVIHEWRLHKEGRGGALKMAKNFGIYLKSGWEELNEGYSQDESFADIVCVNISTKIRSSNDETRSFQMCSLPIIALGSFLF